MRFTDLNKQEMGFTHTTQANQPINSLLIEVHFVRT